MNHKLVLKEKIYFITSIFLLLGMAIFAFANAGCQSFWADELASIGYIRSGISIKEMFENYLFVDTNLPLYSLILYYIYRIMPYGEQYLLIPSILFTVVGIAICAAAVKKIRGSDAAFFTVCIGTASSALLWQAAWEIRCYALVFMLSSWVMLTYINKKIYHHNRALIQYGAALFFLLWSHWFGCIIVAFYGAIDIFLCIRKKIKWKNILPYIIAGGTLAPWLLIVLTSQQESIKDFWIAKPVWKNTIWTILFWLNGNRILWIISLMTCMILIIRYLYRWFIKKDLSDIRENICVQIACAIAWVIGIIFIYSYFINPEGSLYLERYFTVIVPHIFFITVHGLSWIFEFGKFLLEKISNKRFQIGYKISGYGIKIILLGFLAFSWIICYRNSYKAIRKPFQEYRQASIFMVENQEIWKDSTLLIGSNKYCMLDGFIDYYFEKAGHQSPTHIISGKKNLPGETRFYPDYTSYTEEELLEFDKIYYIGIHMGMDDTLKQFLMDHYSLLQTKDENGVEIWEKNQ